MSLAFLIHENIPPRTAENLRELGYDALHVREVGLRGALDPDILAFSISQQRTLITQDSDFSDIRIYPLGTHAGIIRLRVILGTSENLLRVLESLLPQLKPDDIRSGALVISDGRRFRTRRPD